MYRIESWHVILGWAPELYFQLCFYGDQVHICGSKASLIVCVCIPLPLCMYYRCAFWQPRCTLLMARIVVLKVILFSRAYLTVLWHFDCPDGGLLFSFRVRDQVCCKRSTLTENLLIYNAADVEKPQSDVRCSLLNLELETKMCVLRRCTEPVRAAKMRGMLSGVWVTPVILEA